jgi:hypothetical protein
MYAASRNAQVPQEGMRRSQKPVGDTPQLVLINPAESGHQPLIAIGHSFANGVEMIQSFRRPALNGQNRRGKHGSWRRWCKSLVNKGPRGLSRDQQAIEVRSEAIIETPDVLQLNVWRESEFGTDRVQDGCVFDVLLQDFGYCRANH